MLTVLLIVLVVLLLLGGVGYRTRYGWRSPVSAADLLWLMIVVLVVVLLLGLR